MRIDAIRAYSDAITTDSSSNESSLVKAKTNSNQTLTTQSTVSASSNTTGSLITSSERDFFASLFPESSEQLQKHVLFNKNGKIQQSDVSKGVIFDSKC